jgi:hypothetical protein
MAGFHYGACSANLAKFKASLRLTSLRRQRRQSQDTQIRKQLTFTTRELQKQEIGTWKLLRTVQFVASPHHFFLLAWNEKVNYFVQQSGIPMWTTSCLQQHWRFARYIAN